jgi:hypothetical protein
MQMFVVRTEQEDFAEVNPFGELGAFNSADTRPAMSEAVLGRVECSQRDASRTFCGRNPRYLVKNAACDQASLQLMAMFTVQQAPTVTYCIRDLPACKTAESTAISAKTSDIRP